MDDIYGNLENYDEVNTIAELRSENKDLKNKLEEYATAMDKLQNDFDKLATEFKNLECNYSSLLKTARLEIERKTKIITNLNIEKDMMVLNSIKNVNNRGMLNMRHNVTDDSQSFTKINKQHSDTNIEKTKNNTKQLKDCQKLKNHDIARKEDNQTPSEDMVTSSNTDITSRLLSIANKVIENTDSCSDRNSESKENITQKKCGHDDRDKPRTLLKNRRKSMPGTSLENEKLSLNEDDSSATGAVTKDFPSRDKEERKILDRNCSDKQSNKIYETPNSDDKNSGYSDSSRDMRKSRSSRYYDNDTYKSRDKSSNRYKRHFSPVRLHRKGPRDYQEDHYRHRILESPPRDKFNSYQYRHREHRFNYDKSHAHDHQRIRHHHQERLAMKHTIPIDYDEPNNKRLKSESCKRQQDEVGRWNYDIEVKETQAIEPYEFLEDASCQSPDYIHTDAQYMYPIREIRHTAITQLEDPRVTSSKYNIRKNHDGKVVLSTVIGRNIEMKAVKKSEWGIKPVDMPDALVQKPSQINEELVKEIYMDIDIENPILNSSMESGEICFDAKQVATESCQKSKESDKRHPIHDNIENVLPSTCRKYKIPKLKQNDKDIQGQITKENALDVPKNPPTSHDIIKKSLEKRNSSCHLNKSQTKQNGSHDNTLYKNENNKQVENNIFDCQDQVVCTREIVEGDLALSDDTSDYTEFQDEITKQISIQAADENIEHPEQIMAKDDKNKTGTSNKELKWKTAKTYTNKTAKNRTLLQAHISKQNTKYQTDSCNIELQVTNTNNVNKTADYFNEGNDSSHKANTEETASIEKNNDAMTESFINIGGEDTVTNEKGTEEKCKDIASDESKKPKGKKKPQKHKENNSQASLEVTDKPQVIDKKKRSKKDKVTNPKETKNKFSDLFGDSSSLITPEDLGVVTSQGSSLSTSEYVPIFEDAQYAIDLNNEKDNTAVPIPPSMSQNEVLIETDNKTETKVNTETINDIIECKNKSNVNDETTPLAIEAMPTNIYSNLVSGTSCKDRDVVKTVILSSGVQPQCTLDEGVLQDVDKSSAKTHVDLNILNDDKNKNDVGATCQDTSSLHIDALATSTPQKLLQHSMDTISNSSCNSDESRVASLDDVRRPLKVSDTKTINALNDTDVPDVRIISQSFYRRRRKFTKKT